jgi:general secretion pathway protein N
MTALLKLVTSAAALAVGFGIALAANNPPVFDPRAAGGGVSGALDADQDPGASTAAAPISANPLWGIPLATLTATRERPIFLPSRRAPAPAVAAAPRVEPVKAVVAPAEPAQPPLKLVGTVAGIVDSYAVFINDATRDIVRLRTGEGHEGWVLTSVKGREAVLEKNRQTAVMALPSPAGDSK